MRLGQLSRKLSVKAGEIVAFLSSKGVIVEDHVNSRISDADTRLVIGHFAPEMKLAAADGVGTDADQVGGETVAMAESVPLSEEIPTQESIGAAVDEVPDLHEPALAETEKNVVEPEVIKAPKVELQGLKVVGKIDLPEPKKKQPEESVVEGPLQEAGNAIQKTDRRGRGERRSAQTGSQSSSSGSRKNPVARQRERELREAKERKEAELQRKKESRTQFYQQRVKTAPPVRKVNIYDEPLSQLQDEAPDEPKTLWGKFIKWLTSY